jgi:uncharacterized membrane protein YhfC
MYTATIIEVCFMLGFPILLGIALASRYGTKWGLFGAGALAFICSQVVREPLLYYLTLAFQNGTLTFPFPDSYAPAFNVAVLSLSAGLFEEGARYLVYRFVIKKARSWREALMFGAGHGGTECMLVGIAVIYTATQMMALKNTDISQLSYPQDQLAAIAAQVQEYFAMPWYLPLLGAVERLFAMTLHISLAVLVLQAFTRSNIGYLFLAMGWHALANIIGLSVYITWGPVASEVAILVVAVLSVLIVLRYRPKAEALAVSQVP